MALHIRRGDTGTYVHTDDPSVVRGKTKPIGRTWLPEAGQSADCTRVTVRPLDVFEFAAWGATRGAEQVTSAWVGVVAIDGEEATPEMLQQLPPQISLSMIELVLAVTMGEAATASGPLDRSE